jgi:hypothetical protein
MQIVGFNLTKILIQRKEKPTANLEIKSNINIDNITKDKINISKEEVIKMDFTFTIDYTPDEFAKCEFKGFLIMLPEKDELKNILKSWKDKQIPEDIRLHLFNFIMHKCNIKALHLEDELGLPLHIQMPRLSPKKED